MSFSGCLFHALVPSFLGFSEYLCTHEVLSESLLLLLSFVVAATAPVIVYNIIKVPYTNQYQHALV